jgi:hypothetical protein
MRPPFQLASWLYGPISKTHVQYSGRFAEVRLELGTPLRQGLRQCARILGNRADGSVN